ncbi:MAG: CHC2 zinc finger domain-containing protein, partial [Chloroflexi bacterium]|nr:CHC2 zinc finger domain-containing protein [Chloroflexota bacterium]
MVTADVSDIKVRTDLLSLIGGAVRLRRAAVTNGGEYAGPCPFCGGKDRFRVWPTPTKTSEGGRWWCRGCDKQGDAIDFIRQRDGVSFAEACAALFGVAVERRPTPSHNSHNAQNEPPSGAAPEPPAWQTEGLAVIAECEALLWSPDGDRARAWLHARGLTDDTLRQWRLGFNSADTTRHGLSLARGIVIPGIAPDGQLWYLKVRRPAGDPKYKHVQGSRPAMLGRLSGKPALLLTEGEFDMMLTCQEAGDLLDVATFGSADAQPSSIWLAHLLRYPRIFLAYDHDPSGERGAGKWGWTARAVKLSLPLADGEGKDLTDAWKRGVRLHDWITESIAPAATMADPYGSVVCTTVEGCGGELAGVSPETGLPYCAAHAPTAEPPALLTPCTTCAGTDWRHVRGPWRCAVGPKHSAKIPCRYRREPSRLACAACEAPTTVAAKDLTTIVAAAPVQLDMMAMAQAGGTA